MGSIYFWMWSKQE